MAEVTAFGKILRKMRIDCSEVLGVMAKRLKVSPAYLSSITDQKTEADYVETAVMFAKDFSRLSAEQVNELKELLKRFESSGVYQNGSVSV